MAAKFGLLIDAKTKGENNIKRLGNSMQGVQGKAKSLGMAVRGVGGAFKALFAAAAVAGFARFVKGAIDTADSFGKLEVRTGIAAEKLLAYVNAGKLADVSQKQLTTGLRTLARTQAEAADGVKTYSEAYQKLGVSVKRADGSLKPSDQLLGEIADKFQDLPDGPEKAAIAMDLFGKSGADMITLLNGGSEALEEFNYQLSNNFAQNAEYYNDQITRMGFAFDGFRMQLMDALMPALIEITEAFTTLFDTETDWSGLFTVIEAGIRTIAGATYIAVAGFKFLGRTLVDLVKIADRVLKFDFEGASEIASKGLADTREDAFKDFDAIAGIFSRSTEAPEGYGRRTRNTVANRLPTRPTERGKPEKPTKEDKLPIQVSEEVLRLTKEINTARLAGNRLAEVDLGYDLAIQQLKEDGVTGNNLELEQSNLLTQYTLDRLDAVNALADAQDNLNDKTDKYKITLDQVKDTLANQMTSAIEGLIDGTKTLGQSLSGLLRTFASMFLRSGMGSLVNQIFPSAKGNVFAQNGIVPYAKGGYIGRPTMALMGEQGPEAVLPLRRGRGGRLGVETSGGGVGNVVVNVDAKGTSAQGDGPSANQLGKAIGAAVQSELIKQQRPGGLLSR
jgi:hypothetical protein|tara:strand:+ start:7 stop:1863 length:1857 start_codon:yes stop_codon:yes gene_type:complete